MNKVHLIGRLTKDPSIRYSQNQNPICIARFTLAVDRRYKKDGEQNADFISCLAFGKIAEHIEKYYHKGMKTAISGRIQTGSYKHKDGYTVYTTEVVIEEMEFAESKKSSDQYQQESYYQQQDGYYQQSAGYSQRNGGFSPRDMEVSDQMRIQDDELPAGFAMVDDDDVPF